MSPGKTSTASSPTSRDSLEAALRVDHAIEEAFQFLAGTSGAGARCELPQPDLAEVRFWPVKKYRNYLVIYRPMEGGVDVLRVIHAAMDFRRVLPPP